MKPVFCFLQVPFQTQSGLIRITELLSQLSIFLLETASLQLLYENVISVLAVFHFE